MKKLSIFLAVGLVALGILASCSSATSAKDTTTTTTTTATFQASLTFDPTSATKWPTYTIGFTPIGSSALESASMTYAVDTTALNSWFTGATWQASNNKTWKDSNETITDANVWYTSSYTPAANEASALELQFWSSASGSTASALTAFTGAKIYVQKAVLTYADGSVETITFPDSTLTTIHSVLVSGSTTTASDPNFGDRVWNWTSESSVSSTVSAATVAF